MRRFRTICAVAVVGAGLCGELAEACGFEDPSGASAARGILNWVYPNALYVTSAVWRAQLDGKLPKAEGAPAVASLVGYAVAARQMERFRDITNDGTGQGPGPGFSIVLLGPMLWSNYAASASDYSLALHVPGPAAGDVVIVTDTPVISALVERHLTPLAAEVLGLIRYYGADHDVARVRSAFAAAWNVNQVQSLAAP